MKSRHFWQERIYRLLTAPKASPHQVKDERETLFVCLKQSAQEVLVSGVDMECACNTLIQDVKLIGNCSLSSMVLLSSSKGRYHGRL